jgi:hypothetical protein
MVNGETACSHRALLEDRRLPLATGFCSSPDREQIEQLAAQVRALHPGWTIEVRPEGCYEGPI